MSHSAIRACALYNRLTNPAALRTDEQHRIYRKAARKVRAIIHRHALGRESESGRFIANEK